MNESDIETRLDNLSEEYYKRSESYKIFHEYLKKREKDPTTPYPKELDFRREFTASKADVWAEFHKKASFEYSDVDDLSEFIEQYMDDVISSFKSVQDNQTTLTTLRQFKEIFINKMKSMEEDIGYCFLTVNFTKNRSVLSKKIKRLLGKKKKKYFPDTRKRIDELEMYLKIYDLRQAGKKWKDIANIMGRDASDENYRRELLRYYKKAEKIIRNSVCGIFPGKY